MIIIIITIPLHFDRRFSVYIFPLPQIVHDLIDLCVALGSMNKMIFSDLFWWWLLTGE